MASLRELDAILPAYYTLSNQKIILIARVREELVYFYDQLDRNTTIVLLAEPCCYSTKRIFLEIMNDIGATVIDLREQETFDPQYTISPRSKKIISDLFNQNTFEKVITHPKYSRSNDSQNRELFDLIKSMGITNHYTYNKIGINGTPIPPCKVKLGLFKLYCTVPNELNILDKKMLQNYIDISSNISGLRRVQRYE